MGGLGTEFVSRIAVRIPVLLGPTLGLAQLELGTVRSTGDLRIARTVRAAGMLTITAVLGVNGEQFLTLTAGSPDSLARLLVDKVLASSLGRPSQNNLLVVGVPVGDDGGVLGTLLDDGSPLLAALLPLGLGSLRWDTRALLAARVLALGAFLAETKRGVANMALAVNPHPDGLLYTKSISLGGVPLAGLHFQTIQLGQLLSTLLKELSPRDLGGVRISGINRLRSLSRRSRTIEMVRS